LLHFFNAITVNELAVVYSLAFDCVNLYEQFLYLMMKPLFFTYLMAFGCRLIVNEKDLNLKSVFSISTLSVTLTDCFILNSVLRGYRDIVL
jgi:hypothetical protein